MSGNSIAVATLAPLLGAGLIAFMLDAFDLKRAAVALVSAGMLLSGALSVVAYVQHAPVVIVWGVLRVGGVFCVIAAVIALLGALAAAGGASELIRSRWGGSAAGLMAFASAASIVVVITNDITLLLIALETAAACAYALVAMGRSAGAREAAMKYFVQGSIATGFLVFGIAMLVTLLVPSGSLDALPKALAASGLPVSTLTGGVVLFMVALAFKAGAAPLHSWAPDAYESASPESAAFLAAGPKVAAVTALAILAELTIADKLTLPLSASLSLLAIASVLIGSVTALRQRSYTRMLGYAGVAQVGYALIAIATVHVTSVPAFFIACYGLASTGTFLSAAAFRRIDPDWDGSVEGLAGMARRAPLLSAATAFILVSLAGIPPLLGFWAKFFVFVGALGAAGGAFAGGAGASTGWLYAATAVSGILGSVVSLGYYGRALRSLYAEPATASGALDSTPPAEAPGETARGVTGAEDGSVAAEAAIGAPRELVSGGSATVAVIVIAVLVVAIGLLPLWTGVLRLWMLFS